MLTSSANERLGFLVFGRAFRPKVEDFVPAVMSKAGRKFVLRFVPVRAEKSLSTCETGSLETFETRESVLPEILCGIAIFFAFASDVFFLKLFKELGVDELVSHTPTRFAIWCLPPELNGFNLSGLMSIMSSERIFSIISAISISSSSFGF